MKFKFKFKFKYNSLIANIEPDGKYLFINTLLDEMGSLETLQKHLCPSISIKRCPA